MTMVDLLEKHRPIADRIARMLAMGVNAVGVTNDKVLSPTRAIINGRETILAGTNNVGREVGNEAKVADVTRGLKAIVDRCRAKAPNATLVLTAIFPRNDNPAVVPTLNAINAGLARLADGKKVRFLDVNAKLADADGKLFDGMMGDRLHPSLKGYQVWADGLKPILMELLGPPAATDHAPPPTGDPSAAAKK